MEEKTKQLRKALLRSRPDRLLKCVCAFQVVALALLAFKGGSFCLQTALLAVALPVTTYWLNELLSQIWPIDRAFFILVMLLVSLGVVTLTAICRSEETPRMHALYAGVGLVAMGCTIALIRYWRNYRHWILPLALLCLLALFSPWVLGRQVNGARNWITIIPGKLTMQPSEFMKPVLVTVLAAGFSNRPSFKRCLPTLLFAAACCGILLSERDLGAVLLYFLTTVFMYFAATSNGLLSFTGIGVGCVASVVAYNALPYVQKRVSIWMDPWHDTQESGYQLVQALIAIGSGSWFGMGLGLGSPRMIPLYYSDFIFAAMSEEFGLIFAVCVLAVYVVLVLRGLQVAMNARSSFHSLLAFGLMIMLALQTMLIVGGNTKLLPLTGVTLPLMSYGGSSIVSTLMSMGVILAISSLNTQDESLDIEQIALRQSK